VAPQPLEDLLVLDLTDSVAGPYCTKLLGDFGATVVKVEAPGGDPARRMGPYRDDVADLEGSGLFLHLNTNKRSIVVDLDTEGGVEIVRKLAARADIVVESRPPGYLAERGLGPDSLLAANSDLVVTSVTPFGQTGPYRDWLMTDIVAFAMGGPMNASGTADREPVKLIGNAVLMQSGSTACVATLGALHHATESGVGQDVDVATFETQNGSLDRRRYYLLSYEYSGTTAERAAVVGAGRPAAGGRFECADGLMITTGRIWPEHVVRMVDVLDDPRLTARWRDLALDVMVDEAPMVDAVLARWASTREARVAMREAQAAGWPVVVVNDPLLLHDDDHLCARGFWVTADHPAAGSLAYTGAPWRVDGAGWSIESPAPLLGQHTDEVLCDLLDMSAGEIAAQRESGAVA
jgi:crotonobetainyl-CoA:carnitine CoA-transferase CaiB-like acyl-CoA transferase